ncbi:serine/threonine-protein kinase VRK2 isoform X1 [Synchiropus splendidus]|uniref:serine/threonine-protein kinase VRK2 isoform X1 n=1 Tax=Synchiropus splendidus TaxID=270530 RepID=UPI00237D68EF|nr:serine/threonine-protein kinase VRK2 isoform X1 [Synchiropus splendidus]
MAPPKKTALPKPLPDGFILTDNCKKKWRLGKIFGQGGFGLIYLASQDVQTPVPEDTEFVIKLEYLTNGPLFCELKFYQRAAKPDSVQTWMKTRKMDFLGVPRFWGSGQAEHNGLNYRFMAMDRLGTDLQKLYERSGRFRKDTVLQLGQTLVDVLEFIHENEYVHADIKASNLMLGYRNQHQVYLADYGLSHRYCPQGEHIPHKERPKDCHNGTIEYTSLDAHEGVAASRRSDLQILGFCLLHWVCGSLPWEHMLKNPEQVQQAKTRLMAGLPGSVQQLAVSRGDADEVADLLLYVRTLDYKEKPDYQKIKQLLATGGSGVLDFSAPGSSDSTTSKKRGRRTTKPISVSDPESDTDDSSATAASSRRKMAATKPASRSRVRKPVRDEPPEDQQQDKPKPIPACYLRGPPIGHMTTQKVSNASRQKDMAKQRLRSRPDPEPSEEEEEVEDRPRTRSARARRELGGASRQKNNHWDFTQPLGERGFWSIQEPSGGEKRTHHYQIHTDRVELRPNSLSSSHPGWWVFVGASLLLTAVMMMIGSLA